MIQLGPNGSNVNIAASNRGSIFKNNPKHVSINLNSDWTVNSIGSLTQSASEANGVWGPRNVALGPLPASVISSSANLKSPKNGYILRWDSNSSRVFKNNVETGSLWNMDMFMDRESGVYNLLGLSGGGTSGAISGLPTETYYVRPILPRMHGDMAGVGYLTRGPQIINNSYALPSSIGSWTNGYQRLVTQIKAGTNSIMDYLPRIQIGGCFYTTGNYSCRMALVLFNPYRGGGERVRAVAWESNTWSTQTNTVADGSYYRTIVFTYPKSSYLYRVGYKSGFSYSDWADSSWVPALIAGTTSGIDNFRNNQAQTQDQAKKTVIYCFM